MTGGAVMISGDITGDAAPVGEWQNPAKMQIKT
jgi:hypothetical protein